MNAFFLECSSSSSTSTMSVYGSSAIEDLPEYINYIYSFNIFTVFLVTTAIYSVVFFSITLKMIMFYFKTKDSDVWKTFLRPDVFRLFLLMQFWNALHSFMDFFVVRIPLTSIFTSYCAKEKPELLLKLCTLVFTGSVYSSHMLTALFCVQRVALLYTSGKRKEVLYWVTVPYSFSTFTESFQVLQCPGPNRYHG